MHRLDIESEMNLKKDSQKSARKQDDTIKMRLKETEYEGVVWIYVAEDRNKWWVPMNTAVSFRVP